MIFVVKYKTAFMRTSKTFLNLLLILLLFGCQKNDTYDQLNGKWRWFKTVIPYGQIESNPQTSGYTKSLEFLPNETVNEFRNDTLISTSEYLIETSNMGQLRLISTIITSNFSIDKDSLIFNEAYVDGPVIWYIKIKK